nr:hypothetical protein 27 [Saccharospirillaceae bacterium]
MSRRRRKQRANQNHASAQPQQAQGQTANAPGFEAFTFGDPTPVMSRFDLLYTGCWMSGSRWYEPPIDLSALSKSYRATAHHGSAIQVKRNILVKTFQPTQYLSRSEFSSIALDFLVYGNCYGQQITNRLGRLLRIEAAKAKYVRRGLAEGSYWWVHGWKEEQEFPENSIIHIMEPDIDQEIYGLPDYIGGLQAAWLNESATLFRRKYYENGSHAGFIMYMTDPAQKQEDVDALREALRNAKGPGNFRNLFMYAPNGKKDGLQLIRNWSINPICA